MYTLIHKKTKLEFKVDSNTDFIDYMPDKFDKTVEQPTLTNEYLKIFNK